MLVHGGLQLLTGIMVALIYGGMGVGFLAQSHSRDERMVGSLFIVLAFVIAPIVLIFAGIFLAAGMKLLKERSGGRTWGIVASIISLLGFPLGTALGIYGLWFLFGEQGKQFYGGSTGTGSGNFSAPPPPNHWQ